MRIYIQEAGARRFFIPVPTGLLTSRMAARVLYRVLARVDKAAGLEYEQLWLLLRTIRYGKTLLRDQPLVEVRSAGGDLVMIYL